MTLDDYITELEKFKKIHPTYGNLDVNFITNKKRWSFDKIKVSIPPVSFNEIQIKLTR